MTEEGFKIVDVKEGKDFTPIRIAQHGIKQINIYIGEKEVTLAIYENGTIYLQGKEIGDWKKFK